MVPRSPEKFVVWMSRGGGAGSTSCGGGWRPNVPRAAAAAAASSAGAAVLPDTAICKTAGRFESGFPGGIRPAFLLLKGGTGRLRSSLRPPLRVTLSAGVTQDLPLLSQAGGAVELGEGPFGRGIFASRDIAGGEVLLRADLKQCLISKRETPGVAVPSASWDELRTSPSAQDWPRLREWARSPNTDVDEHAVYSLALALVDAASGESDSFWGAYAQRFLPPLAGLSTPICLPQRLLDALEDDALAGRTERERQRLAELAPDMAAAAGAEPSIEWALGCVLSRTFGGKGWDALIPYFDMTNHSFTAPNAEVQLELLPAAAGAVDAEPSSFPRPEGAFSLVSTREIPQGAEVLISYTGSSDNTNRGWFGCYGLVKPNGNPNDDLGFGTMGEGGAAPSLKYSRFERAAAEWSEGKGRLGKASREKRLAALAVSLPIEEDTGGGSSLVGGFLGALGGAGGGGREELEAEYNRARGLWDVVAAEMGGSGTSAAQDRAILRELSERLEDEGVGGEAAAVAAAAEEEDEGDEDVVDGRLAACLRYRIERKELLAVAEGVLRTYMGDIAREVL